MKKKVTMQDVADRIGVSKVTISKAFSGKDDISENLRDKIFKVADDIGYVYNYKGKMLRSDKSYSIGVITSERYFGKDDSFYVDIYRNLCSCLEMDNYICTLHILDSKTEKDIIIPKMFIEQRVDGIIVLGQLNKEYLDALKKYDYPIVFMDFYYDKIDTDCVITDNFFATYELTNLLVENGHERIAYVGNVHLTSSIQDRFFGYYKSILEHRLEFRPEWVIDDRNDESEWIKIKLPAHMPTAFVCNCDKTASILIKELNNAGYSVPEDCSVVGFDDSLHSRISKPQITTVRVNIEQMAAVTAKILTNKISKQSKRYGRVLVKGTIIERESVKNIN